MTTYAHHPEPDAARQRRNAPAVDDLFLGALEATRVAAVNVARFHGHITAPVAATAEALLMEITGLVVALRDISVLGAEEETEPRIRQLPQRVASTSLSGSV